LTVMTDLPALAGPPAPRGPHCGPPPRRPMLTVMTDLPALNGPPAPRGPHCGPHCGPCARPMLTVMTDLPYVPELIWIHRHVLMAYPDREECIIKSKQ
jgi:hypothetical protein